MAPENGSSATSKVVHVQLLGEGTTVFRPVPAEFLDGSTARLLAPPTCDAADEDWEFKPGSVVRVEARALSAGTVLVAVALAETA
jgi:hypothetical protein